MRDSAKRIIQLMFSSIVIVTIVPNMCSAWAGFKPSSGTGGGGGGSSRRTDCDSVSPSVRNSDCNGVSWVYYRFIGTTKNKEITFKPGEGGQKISGDCAQEGMGFWHLGYNATFDGRLNPYNGNSWSPEAMNGWSTEVDNNIQVGDVTGKRLNNEATSLITDFNHKQLKHVLKHNSEDYYISAYYGDEDTVKKAFNALPSSDKQGATWLPDDLYAFCSEDPDAGATFEGESFAEVDDTSVSHGNSVEIHNASGNVVFSHKITRGNDGSSSAQKAKYYVNSIGSGQDIGSNSDWKYTEGLAKTATSNAIITAGKDVSVDPGGSAWVWSRLWLYKTLQGDYKDKGSPKYSADPHCGSTEGRYCIGLTRPYAYFTGSVTATVKKNSARTNVNIPDDSHVILLDDSDDGYYEIKFTSTVTRKDNDGAGGTVKTRYKASRREASTGGVSTATWSDSPIATAGEVDTDPLPQGGSQDVFNPKVSGTLKYGESRTFCSLMQYRNRQLTSDALVDATGSEYCIQITRPKAKCAIGTSFEYGIKDGTNIGAIGVRNFNNTALDKFSWTTASNNKDVALSYEDTNAWAMPGDNIQFKYGACAGAYYAIEFSGLTGKGTHYSTAGWLANNAYGYDGSTVGSQYFGINGNGYLFKSEALGNISGYQNPVNKDNANLAAITATTASPYASWTTGFNGASKPARGFLSRPSNSDPVAEMYGDSDSGLRAKSAASPSNDTYNGAIYNDGADYTYRICKSWDDNSCSPLKKREVGNTIYQELSWNYLGIGNGAVTIAPEVHTARAFVRVPYNYSLEPFVKNEDSSGVVYLGESKIMYPGVVVHPRKNSLVHGGATYATVTKKTYVNVRVYNERTGVKQASKSFTQRLNANGDITTEAKEDTAFMPEGMSFDIVDNGDNQVGDKICTEITIGPVDSHETGNNSEVYGASKNNRNIRPEEQYALYEGYRTNPDGTPLYTKTATSCSTIAKRPTMSVESSNAYSATTKNDKPGFTTGVYAKNTNGGKYIFGSWSEYGVFGRVDLSDGKTFVSGAAIGYGTNVNNYARRHNDARDNDATQVVATGNTRVKTCSFMTQTFVNLIDSNCRTSPKVIGTDSMKSYRDNILERYGSMGEDKKVTAMMGRGDSRINLDISADDIEKYRVEEGNDDSVVALYAATNDAVLSATPKFEPNSEDYHPNRTIIYNVKGTLTIKGNINDERTDPKSMLGDMTGVIIIAKKVWIDADVNYINATIVTRDVDGAEVNTCKYDHNVTIEIGTGNGGGQLGKLDSTKCNKTLVFDGPVFTRKLILNRTAGADQLTGSIKRAEIFNLNMANYLWSFDQMTHYSQAATTYSRELPARY